MSDPEETSLEGRLEALEHLVAICASRLIAPIQIERDRSELRSTMQARLIAGMAERADWVRSQSFCTALDELLRKIQALQSEV